MPSSIHLIIPDSHDHPGVNKDRYYWLGQLILDVRPDVVVNLGDMADMESLCSYDKGTKGFEGRRYKRDIESVKEANAALWHAVNKYNKRQIKNKKAQYIPRRILTVGNHENRINKAVEAEPAILDGTISIEDLGYSEYYDTVVPFLEKIEIDGIVYSHYLQHKSAANAVSGKNIANSLLLNAHCSITVGHTHVLDYKQDTAANGLRIHGLCAGCYFDHDEVYAKESNRNWWRGIIIKNNVCQGDYSLNTITIEEIRNAYAS